MHLIQQPTEPSLMPVVSTELFVQPRVTVELTKRRDLTVTTSHIIDCCPIARLEGSLFRLHTAVDNVIIEWMSFIRYIKHMQTQQ